jgi:hypothetical protein
MPSSLLAPNGRRYIVELGVLDDRAALAFTNGHCHSLALALHREAGGEMVGFKTTETPFDHILVRSHHGQLIDIGGSRAPAEVIASGGDLVEISTGTLERLVTEYGWVPPDPEIALAWVAPLLERVAADEPHRRIGCFTHQFSLDQERVIHVEWSERDGAALLMAFGQRRDHAPAAWTRCATARLPQNGPGERVIDFTPLAFERHAKLFEQAIRRNLADVNRKLEAPAGGESPLCPP